MLITDPHALAHALRQILKEKVVVRYSVNGYGYACFNAELLALESVPGHEYLTRTTIDVDVYSSNTRIRTSSKTISLTNELGALDELCFRWSSRNFDDWCHDEPFMGAYEVYRDNQPYTSMKFEPWDDRWCLLTGVALAEVEKLASESTNKDKVARAGAVLMRRRFSAFVSHTTLVWARGHLTAA